MANVKDDEYETLDFADESEYIGDDEEDEDEGFCEVTVHRAGESPIPCGLELPCPDHTDYPDPQPHWSVRNPVERARIILGEIRDV
jgi:hypothetical protein